MSSVRFECPSFKDESLGFMCFLCDIWWFWSVSQEKKRNYSTSPFSLENVVFVFGWHLTAINDTFSKLVKHTHIVQGVEIWEMGPKCIRLREKLNKLQFYFADYQQKHNCTKIQKTLKFVLPSVDFIEHFFLNLCSRFYAQYFQPLDCSIHFYLHTFPQISLSANHTCIKYVRS